MNWNTGTAGVLQRQLRSYRRLSTIPTTFLELKLTGGAFNYSFCLIYKLSHHNCSVQTFMPLYPHAKTLVLLCYQAKTVLQKVLSWYLTGCGSSGSRIIGGGGGQETWNIRLQMTAIFLWLVLAETGACLLVPPWIRIWSYISRSDGGQGPHSHCHVKIVLQRWPQNGRVYISC